MGGARSYCGIAVGHSARDVYRTLGELRHRGPQGSGLAHIRPDGRVDVLKFNREITGFSAESVEVNLPGPGIFMGGVRYGTDGDRISIRNTLPTYLGGEEFHKGSHLVVRDVDAAIVINGQVNNLDDYREEGESDTFGMLRLYMAAGIRGIFDEVPAAYTGAVMTRGDKPEVVVFRDKYGMRPGTIGKKDNRIVIASEDRALKVIGAEVRRDIEPGEALWIYPDDLRSEQIVEPGRRRRCTFEIIYQSKPDSVVFGQDVGQARYRLGRIMAEDFNPGDIDVVTYVPSAPKRTAEGFSDHKGIPLKVLFYKERDVRGFMCVENRDQTAKFNVYLVDRFLLAEDVDIRGKNLLIIDDTIVRGDQITHAVSLAREAGAKKVYFATTTPPIGDYIDEVAHGCRWGVDMPPTDNFAIRRGGKRGVIKESGADDVFWLSHERMIEGVGISDEELCTFCFGGDHPLDV